MSMVEGELVVRHAPSKTDSSMGRILLDEGKITAADAEAILRYQKEHGLRFGEAALKLGLISDADVQRVLARQFDYPYLQADEIRYPQELVAAYRPFGADVEVLRALRSQLMLRWFARGHKALGIAAVESGDGATRLAANLSVVFSQLGEQTLLVDANMRRPRQHEIFKLKVRQGLSDILADRADTRIIAKVEPFVDLSVLAAGTVPPNPQELVGKSSFDELNAVLARQFDVLLYDLPAFSDYADGYTISAKIGGVLLLARKDKTRLAELNKVSRNLAKSGVEVVGTLLLED